MSFLTLKLFRQMKKINFKNVTLAVLVLGLVTFLSSCSRGGYGCPYELEAANNILQSICVG